MVRLKIDGKDIEVKEGTTILNAAAELCITIPTLCFHKNLLPIGSCRVCVVEVEGYASPIASCTTPVVDGMAVVTRSDKLFRMRQDCLKLLLIHHPLDCPICDAGGECRLQDLVYEHQIEKVDLKAGRDEWKRLAPFGTPLIRYFQTRCVLCLRCVHACREVSGRNVLDLQYRGVDARMASVRPQECISCGECLSVCPVGALAENVSPLKSRIWQVNRVQTTCAQCGFGCTIHLDVYRDRYVTDLVTFPEDSPNKGSLCVLGRFGYDFVNHEAVLRHPSVKSEKGGQVQVSLDEAVARIKDALIALDSQGKAIGFIAGSRITNEEAFLIGQISSRFKKAVIAGPAAYDSGRVLPKLREAGIAYPYSYDAVSDADLVIVAGANLLSNNHVLANRVRDAYKTRGVRTIVVDPSPTPLTRSADVHLGVLPGRDTFLFNAFAARLLGEGAGVEGRESVKGFAEFKRGLEPVLWEEAAKEAGCDLSRMEKAYRLLRAAGRVAVIFGSGVTDCEESLSAMLNLCLLGGFSAVPIARASNSVGVSVLLKPLAPHEVMDNPDVKGLFLYEDDPFHYLNQARTEKAFGKMELVVACDALPSMSTEKAHVVVPTGTFAEKEGSRTAQDGLIRIVSRAMKGADGFQFLRSLLKALGGTDYKDEAHTTKELRKAGVVVIGPDGTERLRTDAGEPCFGPILFPSSNGSKGFLLILRDIFRSHHIAGRDVFSKGIGRVYEGTGYPITEDRLFISSSDAATLGLQAGDKITVDSGTGSFEKAVTIKEGLRPGVLEYLVYRERSQALSLTDKPAKVVGVTVRRG